MKLCSGCVINPARDTKIDQRVERQMLSRAAHPCFVLHREAANDLGLEPFRFYSPKQDIAFERMIGLVSANQLDVTSADWREMFLKYGPPELYEKLRKKKKK